MAPAMVRLDRSLKAIFVSMSWKKPEPKRVAKTVVKLRSISKAACLLFDGPLTMVNAWRGPQFSIIAKQQRRVQWP